MSQRDFIPMRGKVYTSADPREVPANLGEYFTLGKQVYRFIGTNTNSFIRKGTLLNVNSNLMANPVHGVSLKCEAIADMDINALDVQGLTSAVYFLAISDGEVPQVEMAPLSIACVYSDSSIVAWQNGQARAANASFAVQTAAGYTTLPTTQTTQITSATAFNAQTFVAVGDIVNTNVGLSGVVVSVPNNSTIFAAAWAGSVAAGSSTYTNVVFAAGALDNFQKKMKITCTNVFARMINSVQIAAIQPTAPSVNVSTASAVFTVNNSMAGYIIKVGDLISLAGDTGYSNRVVTAINNVCAFTVNAAATADIAGILGVTFNVQAYVISARIATPS